LSQLFVLDLIDRHQLDVPTPLSRPFKKPESVSDLCAVPEFDGYVRFVREDPTKLNSRPKQDAAVLNLFRSCFKSLLYQGSNGLDDLVVLLAHKTDVFKQRLNRLIFHFASSP
jgi:hypothetical protein